MNAIETRGLTKSFGNLIAVDSLEIDISEGLIYGFIGPNGAGKTTTLKMLCGLIKPDRGEIRFFGREFKFGDTDSHTTFGYLPDVPGFYNWMRPKEFLRFSGQLYDIDKSILESRINELLELVGLTGANKKIGGFSRGMRQRLGIAQALIHEPKILFLDEPVSALDPVGRIEVMNIIEKLRGRTTVFFSTHIISDIEKICDQVLILNQGRLEVHDSLENIKQKYPIHAIQIEVAHDQVQILINSISKEDWVSNVTDIGDGKVQIGFKDLERAQLRIPQVLANSQISLKKLEQLEMTLEDIFMKVVKER
ncbi:MAG: ABC transporter ATP-binding protein [Bacillota bacterium]